MDEEKFSIDTKNKHKPLWLAKVPKHLGERILQMKNGTHLGNITIDTNNDGSAKIDIFFESELLQGYPAIPNNHIVDLSPKDSDIHILNADMHILGKISDEIFIHPVVDSEYLKFKKILKENCNIPTSQTKVIDYYEEIKKGGKFQTLRLTNDLSKKRKKELQDKKRERLEKSDIMDIVFNAFEKHDFWTVKDLADFSGQPMAYIQEIVSEICVLNKKDHKNTYELKPDYK